MRQLLCMRENVCVQRTTRCWLEVAGKESYSTNPEEQKTGAI